MKVKLSIITLLAAFALLASTPFAQAQQSREIMLAGYKMDPPVGTSGSGLVTVTLHKDTLTVKGDFSDLMSPFYGAYIMGDIRGRPGNVIYSLNADLNEEKTGGVFKAEQNSFELSPGQKSMLKEGNLYITVASQDHQRGEIRAKIPPMK